MRCCSWTGEGDQFRRTESGEKLEENVLLEVHALQHSPLLEIEQRLESHQRHTASEWSLIP